MRPSAPCHGARIRVRRDPWRQPHPAPTSGRCRARADPRARAARSRRYPPSCDQPSRRGTPSPCDPRWRARRVRVRRHRPPLPGAARTACSTALHGRLPGGRSSGCGGQATGSAHSSPWNHGRRMSNLEEKVVVVMGAGSIGDGWGNGKASAVTYARAGARVVCVDYRLDRAEETAAIITGEGGTALALRADATSEDDVQAVVDAAAGEFTRLDVMHNNVGVGGTSGGPDKIAPDAWRREIDQNLTSAYLGIRCAVPVMQAQGGGVITNISSTMSTRFLRRPSVAYSASKAAV